MAAHGLRDKDGTPFYDTVRGPFSEGKVLYPGARIFDQTHVQICVRTPSKSILGYFRPKGTRRVPAILSIGTEPQTPAPSFVRDPDGFAGFAKIRELKFTDLANDTSPVE
jgi:hypothetical protein